MVRLRSCYHTLRQLLLASAVFALFVFFSSHATAQTGSNNAEIVFWQSVESSASIDEYKAYLKAFPEGQFAPLALLRIQNLSAGTSSSKAAEQSDQPTVEVPVQAATSGPDLPKTFVEGLPNDRPSLLMSVRNTREGDINAPASNIGIFVLELAVFSSAYAAGLRVGDVILSLNEQPVSDLRDFTSRVRAFEADARPTVVYTRKQTGARQIALKMGRLKGTPAYFRKHGKKEEMRQAAWWQASVAETDKSEVDRASTIRRNLGIAMELGDGRPSFQFGQIYQYGAFGFPKDSNLAGKMFEQADALGNKDGTFELAMAYYYGRGMRQDYGRAAELLLKIQDSKPKAAANLAFLYRDGNGVAQNLTKAQRLASHAALRGINEAYHTLSTLHSGHFEDSGFSKNPASRLYLLEKCKNTVANCALDFGFMHLYGDGISKDIALGAAFLRKALEMGNQQAKPWLEREGLELFDAREIQYQLKQLGYPTGEVDGKIGPNSRRMIARFRKDYSLKGGDEPNVQLTKDLRRIVELKNAPNAAKRVLWAPPNGLMARLRQEREERESKAAEEGFSDLEDLSDLEALE